ncbi:hypothetical protein KFU94_66210 [Chloroflexi bacterium TSY]|nr:hypothetical protein [Chloroflexi bacterium TSY]
MSSFQQYTQISRRVRRVFPIILLICLISILSWLAWSSEPVTAQQGESSCRDTLPRVKWQGEGVNEYILEDGYDVFIVKRLSPFRFDIEPGVDNGSGQIVYTATGGERVWVCGGDCQIPSIYHNAVELGYFVPGWQIDLVVIDDDGSEQNNDQRYNWWADNDPMNQYLMIEDQKMVEYLSLSRSKFGVFDYFQSGE